MEEFAATPETGPVDVSEMDSVIAEFMEDATPSPDTIDEVVQEMVKDPEGTGEAEPEGEAPATEDDATEPVEDAEEPEQEAPGDEQTVTVKVNGEERQVPLSEALAGYSRLEDYKAKTAEVAEQRRALEAQATTLEADIKATYANQLEEATNAFAEFDPVLQEARKIDWDQLKATNPKAYVQASDAVNARLQQLDAMKLKVATVRQEAQQHQEQAAVQERAQRFDTAADKIVQANPELADQAKFEEYATQAVATLKAIGFTGEEIAGSLDDRVLTLADEARQWRAHKASLQSLPEKRVVAKSAVKPLASDGGSSRATAKRLSPNATRDQRLAHVVNELLSEE